ncbi:GDSL-type esterase/lipase family protein [Millisia brevis]|uniref:GDSL-type esterase/lipase family protein n=1 Tax=Millisia brevis TaxID=264148 RepID=UPI000830B00B|nr:GDSL-type esterase/lipase family protein [Millisia brevis]
MRRLPAILLTALLVTPAGMTTVPTAHAQPITTGQPVDSVTCDRPGWVRAWSSNMGGPQRIAQEDNAGQGLIYFESYPLKPPRPIGNQSLRMLAAPKTSGDRIRLTLSNTWGTTPLTFTSVNVGAQLAGSDLVPGSRRQVTFGGESTITVPAGAEIVSDPVDFAIRPFDKVAISFHIPDPIVVSPTHHMDANRTSYLTPFGSGDAADSDSGAAFTEQTTSNYFAAAIDTVAGAGTAGLVAFGESFTEPITTTVDAETRTPDFLTRRLAEVPGGDRVVVTMGTLSFNFVTDGPAQVGFGPHGVGWGGIPGRDRIVADALDVPGTRAVLLLHGLNDLAFGTPADAVIDAYRDIVAKARDRDIRVIAATLTPTGAARDIAFMYALPGTQAEREKVNHFIRTAGLFDMVVDYDLAVRDPANPSVWAPGTSPDQVHPGDLGTRIQADAIDLDELLAIVRC